MQAGLVLRIKEDYENKLARGEPVFRLRQQVDSESDDHLPGGPGRKRRPRVAEKAPASTAQQKRKLQKNNREKQRRVEINDRVSLSILPCLTVMFPSSSSLLLLLVCRKRKSPSYLRRPFMLSPHFDKDKCRVPVRLP